VADADGPAEWFRLQPLLQVYQLAFAPSDGGLALEQGADSGGIVAPVFQFFQSVKDDGGRFLRPDVTDYSAHGNLRKTVLSVEFLVLSYTHNSKIDAKRQLLVILISINLPL
jgi:hypothetical protein